MVLLLPSISHWYALVEFCKWLHWLQMKPSKVYFLWLHRLEMSSQSLTVIHARLSWKSTRTLCRPATLSFLFKRKMKWIAIIWCTPSFWEHDNNYSKFLRWCICVIFKMLNLGIYAIVLVKSFSSYLFSYYNLTIPWSLKTRELLLIT